MDLDTIHDSLVNGQRKQMVKQIDIYGLYNFFADYAEFLGITHKENHSAIPYFLDAVTSYHRIKNR